MCIALLFGMIVLGGMEIPEGYVLIKQVDLDAILTELGQLREEVKELRARLKLGSHNSHKPPSSDGFKKVSSLREKGSRQSGAQKGHKGSHLEMSSSPGKVVVIGAGHCPACGEGSLLEPAGVRRRQLVDIPAPEALVEEYQSEQCRCLGCGALFGGAFPEGLTQPVQYGPRIKALAVYYNCFHLIPYKRVSELMGNLYGLRVSGGFIQRAITDCAGLLAPHREAVGRMICQAGVAGFDETGLRVAGGLAWMHVASTPRLTHLSVLAGRGKAAMDQAGVLPGFTGTAVHDRWASYFMYRDCHHALCNAHLLRELKHLHQDCGQRWALDLEKLLLRAKRAAEAKVRPSPRMAARFESRFRHIVGEAWRKCVAATPPHAGPKPRGKKRQSKQKNLLDDLKKRWCEFMAFLKDPQVPFDNNGSERDIRMAKVKIKVSGCFRTNEGAQAFATIRAYINTAAKSGFDPLQAINEAFHNRPFIPVAE